MPSPIPGLLRNLSAIMGAIGLLISSGAWGLSMTFINPGKSNEPYWMLAVESMQAVAASLDIELEVLTAERDYLAQVHLVELLSQRPRAMRPDYLIIAGEKATLKTQLEAAAEAAIPTFLAFNNVPDSEHEQVGHPRQLHSHWLGSLSPNAEEGGYLAARALIMRSMDQLPEDAPLNMIALAGDKSTHTSLRRTEGMLRALAEYPRVSLQQLVYSDWSYYKALDQSRHLLRRYPSTQLVWAASELQAFGAIQAFTEQGKQPGRDVFVSAINATPDALRALLGGELTALAGGHHMAGAWAMVLLYDFHHGMDFVDGEGNAELEYSMFSTLDQELASQLLEHRGTGQSPDFCVYSRACNPDREDYDFTFASWLNSR